MSPYKLRQPHHPKTETERKRKIEKPHRIHTANIILSLCRSRCVRECRLFGVIYLYAHRHKNLSTVVGVCARASNCCCSHRRHRHRVGCKWFGTHSNWPWANNLRTRCVRVCLCANRHGARDVHISTNRMAEPRTHVNNRDTQIIIVLFVIWICRVCSPEWRRMCWYRYDYYLLALAICSQYFTFGV